MKNDNELKKVVWLKPNSEYGFKTGQKSEMKSSNAEKLAGEGFVKILPEDYDEKTNTLPDDFPERNIFFQKGFTTVEEIEALDPAELFELGIKSDTQLELRTYLKNK